MTRSLPAGPVRFPWPIYPFLFFRPARFLAARMIRLGMGRIVDAFGSRCDDGRITRNRRFRGCLDHTRVLHVAQRVGGIVVIAGILAGNNRK